MEITIDVKFNGYECRKMHLTPHVTDDNRLIMWYPSQVTATTNTKTYFELDKEQAVKLAKQILKYYNEE